MFLCRCLIQGTLSRLASRASIEWFPSSESDLQLASGGGTIRALIRTNCPKHNCKDKARGDMAKMDFPNLSHSFNQVVLQVNDDF